MRFSGLEGYLGARRGKATCKGLARGRHDARGRGSLGPKYGPPTDGTGAPPWRFILPLT
jgi:hypothetical protein